jgi:hypothetical protein
MLFSHSQHWHLLLLPTAAIFVAVVVMPHVASSLSLKFTAINPPIGPPKMHDPYQQKAVNRLVFFLRLSVPEAQLLAEEAAVTQKETRTRKRDRFKRLFKIPWWTTNKKGGGGKKKGKSQQQEAEEAQVKVPSAVEPSNEEEQQKATALSSEGREEHKNAENLLSLEVPLTNYWVPKWAQTSVNIEAIVFAKNLFNEGRGTESHFRVARALYKARAILQKLNEFVKK